MAHLELSRVVKRFDSTTILHGIDLQVEDGEFVVFVGPSGCGKSTLLRVISGLESPTSGDILIDSVNVNAVSAAHRGCAMVFQSYALYPHMTVYDNMAFGLENLGEDKAQIQAKVQSAAAQLRLQDLLQRKPTQLSGGQRQRVAIGRAIVRQPKLFLFDEPLSNLDAELRVSMRSELRELHTRLQATMVYVTHDQVEAMTLAHKIVLLHTGDLIQERGSIAQVGTPMNLYHRPASLFVAEFIGSPKMNLLSGHLLRAEENYALVRIGGHEISVAVDARHLQMGAQVQVGVRPEHIAVAGSGEGAGILSHLHHLERLGDSSLLYVRVGVDQPITTVKVDGSSQALFGSALTLRLLPEHLHLFDSQGMACRRTLELPI